MNFGLGKISNNFSNGPEHYFPLCTMHLCSAAMSTEAYKIRVWSIMENTEDAHAAEPSKHGK